MRRKRTRRHPDKSTSKRHTFYLIVSVFAIVIICLALVLLNIGSLKQEYSRLRSRDFLKKAKESLEQNKISAAKISLQNAARHTPDSAEILDFYVELLSREASPELLSALAYRFHKYPTRKNAIDLLENAINSNKGAEVLPLLQKILDSYPNDTPILRLVAILFVGLGQLSLAEQHLNQALALDPENLLLKYDLATLHLASTDQQKISSARAYLEKLRKTPEYFLVATRSLAAHLSLTNPPAALALYEEALSSHPADWLSRIRSFQLLCKIDPEQAARKIEEIFSHARDLSQKAELLTTLLGTFGPETVLEVSKKFDSSELMLPVIRLTLINAHWKKASYQDVVTLAKEGYDHSDRIIERAVYLNWIYSAQNELRLESDAGRTFRSMYTLASQDSDVAHFYYNLFASRQQLQTAVLFLELVALDPKSHHQKGAITQLFNYYRELGDTKNLIRIHEAALKYLPESVAVQNNLATLLILTGKDHKRALKLAENAYNLAPNNYIAASTYAHALAVNGRTTEALRLYDMIPLDQYNESIKLYYANTLRLAGQLDKASEIVAELKAEHFLPEEKKLIEEMKSLSVK